MKLERAGGWLLLLGGMVFLIDLFAPKLKNYENYARMAVAAGAGLFVLGHVL